MKELFKKISIDNGFFGSVILDIFDKDKERVSVIYGANGTGKTTIGRAFSFINNPIEFSEFISHSSILDGTNGPIILSEEEKQKIYVFNEDFIDKEVSFRSVDKMKSIVMFGKNIENEAKIGELAKKIESDKKAVSDLKMERYDDKKETLSHMMYYDQIKKEASQDWAVEEQKILERQSKPPVSDEVMEKILGYDFSKKFDLNDY
jgi:AAA15 family ATPase/GTPase